MRLARWTEISNEDGPAWRDGTTGFVADDRVYQFREGADLVELLRDDGGALRDAVAEALLGPGTPLASVRLLPPIVPRSVRDFITFHRHLEGVTRRFGQEVPDAWYEAPTFYFTNPHSMIGAYDAVPTPPGCEVFDFELEVAVVVGRDGYNLSPDQARDHIAGYTVLNDWSARDLQAREMTIQLGPSKGKDTACTLGPWIVTADELEHFRDDEGFLSLDMEVRVNGEVVGRDSTSRMSWTFEEMIAYASRGTWVRAGDVLGSGTCGSGCLAELWGRSGTMEPPPLRPGDHVTMTVEGLGTIENLVTTSAPVVPLARARVRT